MAADAVYDCSLLDYAGADSSVVEPVPPIPVFRIEARGHLHHEHQPANVYPFFTNEMQRIACRQPGPRPGLHRLHRC